MTPATAYSVPMQRDQDEPPAPPAHIRTHLANERTFLAWSRTGFTAIALGLAAAQLLDRHVVAGVAIDKLLAGCLVTFGMVLVLAGRFRYRQSAIGIRDNTWRAHRRGLEVVVIGTVVVTAISILFIWKT